MNWAHVHLAVNHLPVILVPVALAPLAFVVIRKSAGLDEMGEMAPCDRALCEGTSLSMIPAL